MDTLGGILANAREGRQKAMTHLAQVVAGSAVLAGQTKDESIKILAENIAAFDLTIKQLGWRDAKRT